MTTKKGYVDPNRLPETDPHMKRFFDIDTAKKKMRYQMFVDKLKQVYPDAIPMQNIKSPELCDQCEGKLWTRQIWIQKNINQGQMFVTCDDCWPALNDEAKQRGIRIHVLRERQGGLG